MLCTVFRPYILVPTSPGPFMAVLFAKLENMLQNSVYVNFLLTGLVAQLACHPQPLAMARQKSPKLHDFCHQARMCCRIFLNTAH